jgi:hypothetical protein
MNSPTLFLAVLAATLIVGVLLGRRYEACNHVGGMLADGERDRAVCDEAENGWAR